MLNPNLDTPASTPVERAASEVSSAKTSAGQDINDVSAATLNHTFVEAAIQHPEADAVVSEHVTLTYAELLIRAQNIAVVLKKRGIGPGHFVGVVMEHSPVTITAIVGIILAGAAYVPLSQGLLIASALRHLRSRRVELILCDSSPAAGSSCADWERVGTVLDVSRIEQETMPVSEETKMLEIGTSAPAALLIENQHATRNGADPEIAEVLISHCCIAHLTSPAAVVKLAAWDIVLVPAPSAGQPGLLEMWGGLLHGATIALAPAKLTEIEALAQWIRRRGVSVLSLTVNRVHEWIDRAPEVFATLSQLIIKNDGTSGALSLQRVEWLQREYPNMRMVNTYGTLHTAGFATVFHVPPDYRAQSAIPIGRALQGSQAHVLDALQRPVRAGELGELAFSGDCVASSINIRSANENSEETTQLYLTGQRARMRADGLLELHGHTEPQRMARVRGFEPANVEAIVVGRQKVSETAVIEEVRPNGMQQLVAFVTMEDEEQRQEAERRASSDQLEDSLRAILPSLALPSAVRHIEELPHDAYGDVDRHAMRQRWKKENERSLNTGRMQEDMLEQVRSLWQRLLNRRSIGYEEDFFEAGGTQLQLIRMHAEINRKFPGAITMGQLSGLGTIHKIYEHLVKHAPAGVAGFAKRGA